MYFFKKKKINFSFSVGTSSIILFNNMIVEYGLSGISDVTGIENTNPIFFIDAQVITDTNLGKLRTQGYVTAAQVFQKLKDKYKFFTYFKLTRNLISDAYEPKLFFGVKYALEQRNDKFKDTIINKDPIKFSYPYQSDKYPIIQNKLDYQYFNKTDDLVVVGSSTDSTKNNKKTIATINGIDIIKKEKLIKVQTDKRLFRIDINVPDVTATSTVSTDGTTVTTQSTKDFLEVSIKDSWNNYPISGFKGSFTTFGFPFVQQGDTVELTIDDGFGVFKTETYYVDKVVTKINMNAGFQQEVFVGSKINI